MKILLGIFCLLSNLGFCQMDTVTIDTDKTALNYFQCKKILFDFGKTLRYPTNGTWTKEDSSFINNSDTIYFRIIHHKKLRVEGKKLPQREATDTVKFYNAKLRMYKIEYWKEAFGTNHGNEFASWSETSAWQFKIVFKKNDTYRLFTRSLKYSKGKKWLRITEIIKYENFEAWPIRTITRKL